MLFKQHGISIFYLILQGCHMIISINQVPMNQKNIFSVFVILIILLGFTPNGYAQANRGNDTTFYIFFPESITGRFYFSQKNTSLYIKNKDSKSIHYAPNTTFNMGVGATYHNFSLNLAYGFGFLNKDENKGKTKYLDLQGHFHTPKWVMDCYGQFYRGYHLSPQGFTAPPGKDYYYRPDVKVALMGLSQYRVFNSTRYSYRASLLQNEWQKRSAGTLLAGAEIYYSNVKADSVLIPAAISSLYPHPGVNKISHFSIGPGIGYAYTLVGFQHLFITGSLTANLNIGHLTEYNGAAKNSNFSVNPVTRWRVAAGYNGRLWNLSANWVADYLPLSAKNNYAFQTGNYRFIVAKRFATGEKLKKTLKPLAAVFKE